MDAYLQNTLGVANAGLRANIIANFVDVATMAMMSTKEVSEACMIIRKGAGQADRRAIPLQLEKNLKKVAVLAKYRYLIQRQVDTMADYTMANLDSVWEFHSQLDEDPEDSTVKTFSERGSKKIWFESVDNYFSSKKGKSGFPIRYAIRPTAALPAAADDPGFLQPSIEVELYTRGT